MFHCTHILWCGHFSNRIAGSRLLNAWHLNTSYIILFTQITHMYFFSCIILTVSPMQMFHCCRYNHPHRCDLIDQFDIQPERNNRRFDWWLYQALLRHTNNIITKSVCIGISECMETVTPSMFRVVTLSAAYICTTWHSLINIFHLKRWYNDIKYTRRNIIASAKLPFKCAVGMWESELVESWLK